MAALFHSVEGKVVCKMYRSVPMVGFGAAVEVDPQPLFLTEPPNICFAGVPLILKEAAGPRPSLGRNEFL